MMNNELDNIIRKKLEGIDPIYDPETWKLLEQKLNGSAVTDLKSNTDNNTAFDHLIADKISGLQINYDESAWAAMEQKLDGEQATTPLTEKNRSQLFDQLVFEKLKNYQAPYSSKAWNSLVNTLNLERNFYRLKLAEATIVVLLLLFAYQTLPVQQHKQPPPLTPEKSTPEEPVYQRPIAENTGTEQSEVADQAVVASLTPEEETVSIKQESTRSDHEVESAGKADKNTEFSKNLAILLEGLRFRPLIRQ